MPQRPSALASWSPEQIARGREWVAAWERAAPEEDAAACVILANVTPLAELTEAPEIVAKLERLRARLAD